MDHAARQARRPDRLQRGKLDRRFLGEARRDFVGASSAVANSAGQPPMESALGRRSAKSAPASCMRASASPTGLNDGPAGGESTGRRER